jgi:hypothetical protein
VSQLETFIWWELEKREHALAEPEYVLLGRNEMTTVGVQYLLDVIRGSTLTPLNAALCQVAVGSSSTAFSAAHTDLQAAVAGSTAITAATNASPIQLTAAAHGLATGASVTISGVGGNTAANGSWSVTVLDANTLTLNGSTGNGAYTSGGTIATGNRVRRPMVGGFPSRTTFTLNFQGSFGATEANFAWAEWALFCAAPTNLMVSRRVQALGTKVNPNVWSLTAHLQLA